MFPVSGFVNLLNVACSETQSKVALAEIHPIYRGQNVQQLRGSVAS